MSKSKALASDARASAGTARVEMKETMTSNSCTKCAVESFETQSSLQENRDRDKERAVQRDGST